MACPISLICAFENSSGNILIYADAHDWQGSISKPPYQYPDPILYERVVGFKDVGVNELESAVIYRAEGSFDWLVCWYVTCSGENYVYTEIGPVGQFSPANWDHCKALLKKSPSTSGSTYNGYRPNVRFENGWLLASIEKIN